MFQPIDVRKFEVRTNKRVALLNYDKNTQEYEFRHYSIVHRESGVSKGVQKLLRKRKKFDMSRSDDIGDYVLNGGYASDSEVEDNVPVPLQNRSNQNVEINLVEQGPRMKLKLVKIEDEVCGGKIIHEEKISRTDAEFEHMKDRFEAHSALNAKAEEEKAERRAKRKELRVKRE